MDTATKERIEEIVKAQDVAIFMKGTPDFPACGFSAQAIQVLKTAGVEKLSFFNVLEDDAIRQGVKEFSNWPTIPQVYVKGEFIGGSDVLMEMYQRGDLQKML